MQIVFFLGVNFCNLVGEKKRSFKRYKGFFLEKMGPSCHSMREKNLMSSHLDLQEGHSEPAHHPLDARYYSVVG